MDDILKKLEKIEAQLTRMWLHIDFIRTHSAIYLGDGLALTHLADETRMLVNANDSGGPVDLMSGGRYEDDNLDVLLSFLRDDSVFLDIGANLGFFSLKLGNRLRRHGRVIAFEPHPRLARLIQRNAEMNDLKSVITVNDFGLSDVNASVEFSYPKAHLGGGRIGREEDPTRLDVLSAKVRRLDDVLDPELMVDLIKIDVEDHELAVLRGMREVIARSPRVVILFEKLGRNTGSETGMEALFADWGMTLFSVNAKAVLSPLRVGELMAFSGYVLAARPGLVDDPRRQRFTIYPSQLNTPDGGGVSPGQSLVAEGRPGDILFSGPYWFLPRGVWNLQVVGGVEGQIEVTFAERFGYATEVVRLAGGRSEASIINQRDLVNFELVARPVGAAAQVDIERLELKCVG